MGKWHSCLNQDILWVDFGSSKHGKRQERGVSVCVWERRREREKTTRRDGFFQGTLLFKSTKFERTATHTPNSVYVFAASRNNKGWVKKVWKHVVCKWRYAVSSCIGMTLAVNTLGIHHTNTNIKHACRVCILVSWPVHLSLPCYIVSFVNKATCLLNTNDLITWMMLLVLNNTCWIKESCKKEKRWSFVPDYSSIQSVHFEIVCRSCTCVSYCNAHLFNQIAHYQNPSYCNVLTCSEWHTCIHHWQP